MIAFGGWLVALATVLWLLHVRRTVRAQRTLVARACHELRRPVTAARLGVDAVTQGATETAAALPAIDLELASAGLALEDLEAAAQGMRGPLRVVSVEIAELLAEIGTAFEPLARARGRELGVSWEGEPSVISADRLRLAQAAGNLIANAIEHGSGPVELRGRAVAGKLEIAVADGGPGLPGPIADLRRHRPAHGRSRRRTDRRHGHGLAVAADVAALHGGELVASGATDSEVALRLPVRRS